MPDKDDLIADVEVITPAKANGVIYLLEVIFAWGLGALALTGVIRLILSFIN